MAKSNPFTIADLEAKGYTVDATGAYAKNNVGKPIDIKVSSDIIQNEFTKPEIGELQEWADSRVVDKLLKDGVVVLKTSRPKGKIKIPKSKPEGLQAIERVLKASGVKYVTEHKFMDSRKFRFDCAIIDKKIAIEYEGIFSEKSRHTGLNGYTTDATKYNFAVIEGWKVLRYTALNYKNFVEDLKKLL